ncbi:MAG: hypothetical protein KIT33_11660 [Candidatus Kapabacteria bacterium]|nr:hypothetical protein [Ignavibacteriota bacterium]MCW5885616.1 hypothetical protein [Candidatus Kapabacteria bacterium]
MNLLKKVNLKLNEILENPRIQRILYVIALLIWIWLFFDIYDYNSMSSIGISYFWLVLIPSVLLIIQIFFNTFWGWVIIYLLMTFFAILSLVEPFKFYIDNIGTEKRVSLDAMDALVFLFFYSIVFIVFWIVSKIKPKKINYTN